MPKTHWTDHLQFVGNPIKYKRNSIMNLQDAIAQHTRDIEKLQREILHAERELLAIVENDWTADEIETAKKEHSKLHHP